MHPRSPPRRWHVVAPPPTAAASPHHTTCSRGPYWWRVLGVVVQYIPAGTRGDRPFPPSPLPPPLPPPPLTWLCGCGSGGGDRGGPQSGMGTRQRRRSTVNIAIERCCQRARPSRAYGIFTAMSASNWWSAPHEPRYRTTIRSGGHRAVRRTGDRPPPPRLVVHPIIGMMPGTAPRTPGGPGRAPPRSHRSAWRVAAAAH